MRTLDASPVHRGPRLEKLLFPKGLPRRNDAVRPNNPSAAAPAHPSSTAGLPSPPVQGFAIPGAMQWLNGGTAVLDAEGRIQSLNDALLEWLGVDGAPVTGTRFCEWLAKSHPPLAQFCEEALADPADFSERQAVDPGPPKRWFSIEVARSREVTFVRINSALPPFEDAQESAWDEHLKSEASQREMFRRWLHAEAQLHKLVHRWPGVVFSQGPEFDFQFVSPRVEEFIGWSVDEIRGNRNSFWSVVHEGDVDELQRQFRTMLQTRRPLTSTFRIRHSKTGRIVYVMEYREPVMSPGGLMLGYEGVWLDVTRQAIAEKRLSSAAWKETLAVVTMGLAHDFSNIMAGILSLSESFQTQVDAQHPFYEGLTLIQKSSIQANQLVQRILKLHQGRPGERNYYNLNELVGEIGALVQKIIPRRIRMQVELSAQSVPVYLDAFELQQVLINLTLNAVDAMPNSGVLTIRSAVYETMPELMKVQGTLPRLPAACLEVQDTGTGIPRRSLDAIFDPFYTTKPINKGSGLGLYNAQLFAEKSRGCISVNSVEGEGTTFRLWLPQADFSEADEEREKAVARRHTVLVLGDAGSSLEGMVSFLRENGFYVVDPDSYERAVNFLISPDYQISAALVQVSRADSPHVELFAELKKQRLAIKRVLQIVECQPDAINTSILEGSDLVLSPDLPPAEMLSRLRSLLDEAV
jgi:PAS domain S-box-containing protein